jgi:serine/threonine protein kinase
MSHMADRVGQQLGNYTLTRLLGEGGFAQVYVGEHMHLGTLAAIKVLHTQLSEDTMSDFRNEARTIARLQHPHIVRVLEFGIEGKTPFLVMDYASNGTLRQLHPRGSVLPLATVVSYVKQIADALQYAHEEKLIHRDVKPENMLIGRRNEILLSDFGIALVAQSSRYQSTQEVIGTVAYMSPEQIQGKPRPASDQYSLAIAVYEWLGGDRPFHGSFTELCTQHMFAVPPPLREKNPNVTPEIAEVITVALAKDPHQCFGSIEAFATAFEQACSGQTAIPTFVKSPLPPTVIHPLQAPVSGKTPQLPPTQVVTPVPDHHPILVYRGHSSSINAIVWSPDGTKIASASSGKTVQIWEVATGNKLLTYQAHTDAVLAVSWSPDGQWIVSGSKDETVKVWNTTTRNTRFSVKGHSNLIYTGVVYTVAWSPHGQHIASGDTDGNILVRGATHGEVFVKYRAHSDYVRDIAWSPNGEYLTSASEDHTAQVWQALSHIKVSTFRGHNHYVRAVAWSPANTFVASASEDGTVQIWKSLSGQHLYTYPGHKDGVYALTWSPQGVYIASAGKDRSVQVWNANTGKCVLTYRGHTASVNAVAWSPDGKYIASAGDDQTVRVWRAPQ